MTAQKKSLPKAARLLRHRDFDRLRLGSKSVKSAHLVLLFAPSKTRLTRLGITVTKKVDKRAVARNYIKRRVREFFRLHRSKICAGIDIVVIARSGCPELSTEELWMELERSMVKAKILSL